MKLHLSNIYNSIRNRFFGKPSDTQQSERLPVFIADLFPVDLSSNLTRISYGIERPDSQLDPIETPGPLDDDELSAEASDTETTHQSWKNFQGLTLNTDIFKKGIIVVKPYNTPVETSEGPLSDQSSFSISSRKLCFSETAIILAQGSKKTVATFTKTTLLLNKLKDYIHTSTTIESGTESDFIIANSVRREEFFFPFIITNNQQHFGFYVYPWLSNNTTHTNAVNFSGFKKFVTAGCMFGSTLKGIDQLGSRLNLIKHDIQFHPSQKILKIDFNPKASNPYEKVIFDEFKQLMLLMNNLSDPEDRTKELYYHLPYYDYMLFGIELFIRNRMTFEALDEFFKVIISKKTHYTNKIKEICRQYKIKYIIESPFENLFGELPTENITQTLLSKLELELITEESTEQLNGIQEQELVQRCLQKLQTNNFNPTHQQVWQDLFKVIRQDDINTLEKLFKVANAFMVLLASHGTQNYTTCSFLPISEKQIQVTHSKFKELGTNYPAVFNITTIDPIISYDLISKKGLLFYFDCCQDSLSKVVERDMITHAHRNIARMAKSTAVASVEDILHGLAKLSCKA